MVCKNCKPEHVNAVNFSVFHLILYTAVKSAIDLYDAIGNIDL